MTDVVPNLIDRAKEYVGMRSRANKVNGFGAKAGFDGKPWDGSFLEVLYRENSVSPGTSMVSTTAALAYFNRTNRIFTKPRPGDIVFFAWSTDDDGFGQPHVGLVTETRDWKKTNRFRTVEAQVPPGTAKGHTESDGVYDRVRYGSDVLAFARPVYRTVTEPEPRDGLPNLRPSQFQMNRVSKATVLLQSALHDHLGAHGFVRGKFDSQTRSAVLRFQREIGHVRGNGMPDERTLEMLARVTGYQYFRARKLEP